MAGKKISSLSPSSAQFGDEIPVTRGTDNFKVNVASIAALASAPAATSGDGFLNVNDFYPPSVVAHDGFSHPLSGFYATLGDAQAYYPHATSLTDEFDWCAWQACVNFAYQRDFVVGAGNRSSAAIHANGKYVVNKSIVMPLYQVRIEGANQPSNFSNGSITSIKYNGTAGTVDDPIAIIDFYPANEHAVPPPGYPVLAGGSGSYFRIYNIGFFGKSGSMTGDPSGSSYIQGIRIRISNFAEIARCTFGGTLYDGLSIGLTMFCKVRNNFFYGCHRDGISFYAIKGNFSTTMWIDENEFGYVGRYACIVDVAGSVIPSVIYTRNDVESTFASWYTTRPAWWVQGVVAPVCFIGVATPSSKFEDNRFEGVTFYPGIWADWHFCGCSGMVVSNNVCFNTVLTQTSASNLRTPDGITWMNARGYMDITDTRNYLLGTPGDATAANQGIRFTHNWSSLFYFTAGTGFGSSVPYTVIDNQGSILCMGVPPVVNATWGGYMFGVPETAIQTMQSIANVQCSNAGIVLGAGRLGNIYGSYDAITTGGSYTLNAVNSGYSIGWLPSHAYKAETPSNGGGGAIGHWFQNGKWVTPTVYNGYLYEATVTGTSGTSEPTWPTTIGNTVADGGVTWKCLCQYGLAGPWSSRETMELGVRHFTANGSAPTTGRWSVGDIAYNRLPVAGGFLGYVCTTAGIPGTWKTFGPITA